MSRLKLQISDDVKIQGIIITDNEKSNTINILIDDLEQIYLSNHTQGRFDGSDLTDVYPPGNFIKKGEEITIIQGNNVVTFTLDELDDLIEIGMQ